MTKNEISNEVHKFIRGMLGKDMWAEGATYINNIPLSKLSKQDLRLLCEAFCYREIHGIK